ncbi:unnamed protein product [Cuscuta campestris]|uniref:Uncharacterized protein n=1 Tax=Cuscuta campestris TaxID=132261 RepID=A0A484LWX0_9ASTE|nr:unnamed protein product [Cuscuta campestris]
MRRSSNDDRSRWAWAVTGLLRQRYRTVRDAVYPPFGSSSLSYHLGDHSHTMKESLCSSRSPSSKVFVKYTKAFGLLSSAPLPTKNKRP